MPKGQKGEGKIAGTVDQVLVLGDWVGAFAVICEASEQQFSGSGFKDTGC